MTVFVCVPDLPMRIVFDSPARPLTLAPISMLLLPVVRFEPAWSPMTVFTAPVVLALSASKPMAVLPISLLLRSAKPPIAVLSSFVVL
jgi:hypothetical protein